MRAEKEPAEAAENEKLSIEPKGNAKKLNDKGKTKVKANVTYT